MPAARSVYTINHSCDKLSWTYNSRWKTSSQTSDLATLLIAEVTFLLQMITMLVGLEWCCVLLFLLKIMPGWKIIMEVFCVFIACVISCWFGAHHAAVTQQKMWSDPHLLMLVKFSLAWKKKKTSNETLLLGQWECALAILTCIPCAHAGANIQHFIFFRDLKTCTHWANTASIVRLRLRCNHFKEQKFRLKELLDWPQSHRELWQAREWHLSMVLHDLSPRMLNFAAAFGPLLLSRPEGNLLCCLHIKRVEKFYSLGANSEGSSK